MNRRINIILENADDYFCFQSLKSPAICTDFDCGIPEYNDYLFNDALRSMNDYIALTWLLTEKSTGKVAAYMSLIIAGHVQDTSSPCLSIP